MTPDPDPDLDYAPADAVTLLRRYGGAVPRPNRPRRAPRRRAFLFGLPADWLVAANRAGGYSALRVGLTLWHRASQQRRRGGLLNAHWLDDLAYPSRDRGLFDTNRTSVRQGLAALEQAGLLRVHRRGRKTIRYSILHGER